MPCCPVRGVEGEAGTRQGWGWRPRGLGAHSLEWQPSVKKKKKTQRNPGWHVSSPDGREIGQAANGFQNQHRRSACCQQIRGMLAWAAEEKRIHPVGRGRREDRRLLRESRALPANCATPARGVGGRRLSPRDRAGPARATRKGIRLPGDRHLEMWGWWLVGLTALSGAPIHSARLSAPVRSPRAFRPGSSFVCFPPLRRLLLLHPLRIHTLPILGGRLSPWDTSLHIVPTFGLSPAFYIPHYKGRS